MKGKGINKERWTAEYSYVKEKKPFMGNSQMIAFSATERAPMLLIQRQRFLGKDIVYVCSLKNKRNNESA